MAFSDPAFEQHRSRIIGGKSSTKITGSQISGSTYNDPSFEARRAQVISAPKPKQQVKFIAPQPVPMSQRLSFKIGQAKSIVKNITDTVKMTFVKPKIVSPVPAEMVQEKPKVVSAKPIQLKPGQNKLNKNQMSETFGQVFDRVKEVNEKLGPLLAKVYLPMQYTDPESLSKPKKDFKPTAGKIIGGFIEDAITAYMPVSGIGLKPVKETVKLGERLISGVNTAAAFAGFQTLIDILKEEKSDMKEFLVNTGIGFWIGASRPSIMKDVPRDAEIGYKQTLEKFGFKGGDFKNPETLKSKFRKVVMDLHPDKGGNPEEFKAVVDAYNKMTSAGVNTKWSSKDIGSWIDSLWKRNGDSTEVMISKAESKLKSFIENIIGKKKDKGEITKYLIDGEMTPQEMINTVLKSGLENTKEGKAVLQAATEAQTKGMNLKVETQALSDKVKLPEKFATPEEQTSLTSLKNDPIKYRDEYISKNNNEINPDLMRGVFSDYKGNNATSYDRFAGALTEMVYDKLITDRKGLGNNTVLMTAGGPGSAKSTIINNPEFSGDKKDYPIVLDTTLSSKKSLSYIKQALDNGYDVKVVYILRDPVEAWTKGVLPRTKEVGRVVTEKYFLEAHEKARLNAIEAYNRFKDNPQFEIVFVDNRGGVESIKEITVDEVKSFAYNKDKATEEIASATDKSHGEKRLSKEQYEATRKDRVIRSKDGGDVKVGDKKQSKDELTPKPPARGEITRIENKINELVGFQPGAENWKIQWHMRNAYIDEALSTAPPEIVKQIMDLTSRLDEVRLLKSSAGSSGFASMGASPIGMFEKQGPTEATNLKLFEKINGLIQKYAKTVGEGYLPRGAAGVIYNDTLNIRINGINNLSVAAHEITHFLDHHYNISDKVRVKTGESKDGKPVYEKETAPIRKQLTEVYTKYYPGGKPTHSVKKRTIEGFATLLQKYVEMPTQIEAEFPDLVKAFFIKGGKFYEPVMTEIIKDLKDIVKEYQGLPSLDKIGARVVNKAVDSKRKDLLSIGEKIRTFLEDEIYPIEKIAKLSDTHFTAGDPSLWLRAFQNASGVYANNIRNPKLGYYSMNADGEFVKKYDFNWKTLIDHLHREKTVDSFGNYLVARDQHYEWLELDKLKTKVESLQAIVLETPNAASTVDESGKTMVEQLAEAAKEYQEQLEYLRKNGFTRAEIDTAFNENNKRFTKEEDIYDKLVREDLELLYNPEVQLINEKTYSELVSKEGYASMKRKVYDDIVGEGNPLLRQPGGTKASSLQSRSGGEQMIINPVLNGMTNHIEIMRKAMKQAIYNKIGKIAESGKMPDFFQKIALQPSIDQNGRITYPQEKDPNIIMARIGYKRTPIVTDLEIKKTVESALTYQTMNVFEQVLTFFARGFTLGTTGLYPAFALVNFTADQFNGIVNTRNNYTPFMDQARLFSKAIFDRFGDGEVYELYKEWQILGGDRMTLFQANFGNTDQALKYLETETSGLTKVIDMLNKGIDIFSIPSKISETASRFAEYYRARKSGKHQLVALEEAGRVTAPFHHVGSWKLKDQVSAKYLFRTIPFANASLQVLAQTVRSSETPEGRKRLFFVMMTMIALGLGSAGLISEFGTDDQKEQYKDLHPTDMANFIHLPYMNGRGLVRVKVSNQMTTLSTVMQMIIAQELFGAKYTIEDYKQAVSQWIPDQFNIMDPVRLFLSWLNPLIKIPFELIANIKDYPNVRPIESASMQNREPKYRYNEYTSGFAKKIGEKFNLSPVKIDFLLEGIGSRFVRFFTAKPGAYSPVSSVYRDYFFTMGRRVEDYYVNSDRDEKRLKTLKDKLKAGDQLTSDEKVEGKELVRKSVIYNEVDKRLKILRGLDLTKDVEQAKKHRDRIIELFEKL